MTHKPVITTNVYVAVGISTSGAIAKTAFLISGLIISESHGYHLRSFIYFPSSALKINHRFLSEMTNSNMRAKSNFKTLHLYFWAQNPFC